MADLRSISRSIAEAVAGEAREAGVGKELTDAEIAERLDREMWDLNYATLRPA